MRYLRIRTAKRYGAAIGRRKNPRSSHFADVIDFAGGNTFCFQRPPDAFGQRMTARPRQSQKNGFLFAICVRQIDWRWPSHGERAGLVEHRQIDFGETFERAAVFHQYARAHQRARHDDLRGGNREAERTGASDDQHGDSDQQAFMPSGTSHHPAEKAECGECMDGGRVKSRSSISHPDIQRFALRRLLHQPRNVRDGGICACCGDPDMHRGV